MLFCSDDRTARLRRHHAPLLQPHIVEATMLQASALQPWMEELLNPFATATVRDSAHHRPCSNNGSLLRGVGCSIAAIVTSMTRPRRAPTCNIVTAPVTPSRFTEDKHDFRP